jgi:urease accessory protein
MNRSEPNAQLKARFKCAAGKTQMGECFASAPLKIAKTFALDDEFGAGIGVCVMDCSPGMLAGDHYDFEWHLGENSRVLSTTQGFTRVHPSRDIPCRLKQKITLEDGAILDFCPGALQLFAGASIRTECEVEMTDSSVLMWSEITSAGRIGRGEIFQFHEFQSRLRVSCDGKPIFRSQTALRPREVTPRRVAAWGEWSHNGNFYVFSPRAGEELLQFLRELLEQNAQVWGGASLLERNGVAVSLLGHRAHDLEAITQKLRVATLQYLKIKPQNGEIAGVA